MILLFLTSIIQTKIVVQIGLIKTKKNLVFDRDPLDIIKLVGLRSESPYFLGKGQKQHSLSDTNAIASRLVSKLDEQLKLQMVD